jgi:hypothetical protein
MKSKLLNEADGSKTYAIVFDEGVEIEKRSLKGGLPCHYCCPMF